MNLTVELELEEDGRWIAEITGLPGVLAYAKTQSIVLGECCLIHRL